jgi:Tat protein translocase TatB subunit
VFALILESLGSTELLFILAIALMFFGPRKLPQLARTAGKGLAEFRRASDDFKRTWEREVALETDNVMLEAEQQSMYEPTQPVDTPISENAETELTAADPDLVVPRDDMVQVTSEAIPEVAEIPVEPTQPEPVTKQNWL